MSIYLIDDMGCESGPYNEKDIYEHLRLNNDIYYAKYRQGDKIDYVCKLCNASNVFEWIDFDISYVKYINFDLSSDCVEKIMGILKNDIDNLKIFVGKIKNMTGDEAFNICKINKTLIGSINYKFITSDLITRLVKIYTQHEFIEYIPINDFTLNVLKRTDYVHLIYSKFTAYNYHNVNDAMIDKYNIDGNKYLCYDGVKKLLTPKFKQLKNYNIGNEFKLNFMSKIKFEHIHSTDTNKVKLRYEVKGMISDNNHDLLFDNIGLISYYEQNPKKIIDIIKEIINYKYRIYPLITIVHMFPSNIILDIIKNIQFKIIKSPHVLHVACKYKKYIVIKTILNLYKDNDIKYLNQTCYGLTIEQHINNNKKLSDQQKSELIELITFYPVEINNNKVELNDETYQNLHLFLMHKNYETINKIFNFTFDTKYLSYKHNDMSIKNCIDTNTMLSSEEKESCIQKIEEIEFENF